jgi:hypothetical protein
MIEVPTSIRKKFKGKIPEAIVVIIFRDGMFVDCGDKFHVIWGPCESRMPMRMIVGTKSMPILAHSGFKKFDYDAETGNINIITDKDYHMTMNIDSSNGVYIFPMVNVFSLTEYIENNRSEFDKYWRKNGKRVAVGR